MPQFLSWIGEVLSWVPQAFAQSVTPLPVAIWMGAWQVQALI